MPSSIIGYFILIECLKDSAVYLRLAHLLAIALCLVKLFVETHDSLSFDTVTSWHLTLRPRG